MADRRLSLDDGSLVDLLDRLVDEGTVVDGSVVLTLAGVDLIRLDLRAVLAAVETLEPDDPQNRTDPAERPARPDARHAPETRPERPETRPDWPDDLARPAPGAEPAGPVPPAGVAGAVPPDGLSARITGSTGGTEAGSGTARGLAALADPANRPGLAGLVVAVVDIVRQLLQRQALRRMRAGGLDAAEVEHLGRALMSLHEQVTELADALREPGYQAADGGRTR